MAERASDRTKGEAVAALAVAEAEAVEVVTWSMASRCEVWLRRGTESGAVCHSERGGGEGREREWWGGGKERGR